MSNFSSFFDVDKVNSLVNKVKAVVLNYTEYEAKVRDATNNEPWGASSTLMLDIANATNHFQHFHDIMNTIYKRLGEPPSSTWRQTYKALQLLEYLLKNGSEKVIDAARDHQYELRALHNYTYTDEKHKDQGINIRNRAKEILELLASDDKLRAERQKAKENRAKYKGVSGDQMTSGSYSGYSGSNTGGFGDSGKKYGGFGSDSYNHQSSYDFQAQSSSNYQDSGYNSFGQGTSSSSLSGRESTNSTAKVKEVKSKVEEKKPVAPQVADLLDVGGPVTSSGDDDWSDFTAAPTATSTGTKNATKPDDDFADFQAAPSVPAVTASMGFASFPPSAQKPLVSTSPMIPNSNPSLATPITGAGNFGPVSGAPLKLSAAPLSSQPAPMTGFAHFGNVSKPSGTTPLSPMQSQQASQPRSSDPFGSLVSLDAKSLAPGAKKESAPTGPSLNAIGANQNAMNPSLIGPSGSRAW